MICVIRIAGRVGVKEDIKNTLDRLKLCKKYSCVLVDEEDVIRMGMVNKIQNCIAYGEISDDMIKKLKEVRGQKGDKFFRLHPPRGGFKKSTKLMVPKGILGKHENIDKMLGRML